MSVQWLNLKHKLKQKINILTLALFNSTYTLLIKYQWTIQMKNNNSEPMQSSFLKMKQLKNSQHQNTVKSPILTASSQNKNKLSKNPPSVQSRVVVKEKFEIIK